MLFVQEVVISGYGKKKLIEIIINPENITTVRPSGLFTTINMVDGQTIKVSETIYLIKELLEKYNTQVIDLKVL